MEDKKVTVLAEQGQEVLIRIEREEIIGGVPYHSVRHEWWYDRSMMEQGIRADEDGRPFVRGFAGVKEEEVLELFRNGGWR